MNDDTLTIDPLDARITELDETIRSIKGMIELLKAGNINAYACLAMIELLVDAATMVEPKSDTT